MKNVKEHTMTAEEKKDFAEMENRIMAGRESYRNIPVPEEMERRIREVTAGQGKGSRFRIPAAVAAAVALLILLPNTGADIAYAMGNLPVVGKLFQVVTFRDYQYESERFDANVEI